MRVSLLLVFSVILLGGLADDMDDFDRMMQEPRDRSKWIDPHDMGMRDSRPGTGNCPAVEEKQKQCENDLANCQNNLQNCHKSSQIVKIGKSVKNCLN